MKLIKTTHPILLAAAFLVLAFFLALMTGCAADLTQQFAADRVVFNAALDAEHAGVMAGLVTPKQVTASLPYIKVVQGALDAGERAAVSGDTSAASVYLKAVNAGMADLAKILPAPTTKPTK